MSLLEAATNAIYKLENNPEFAQIAESEHDTVPKVEAILAKKSEGRPVTPEEYRLLTKFVDHVESGLMRKREDEKKLALEQEKIARANIPPTAFEISLSKFEVSDRLYTVISETGVDTVGDIMLQLETDPDSIWRLNGMGPKSMAELEESIDQLKNKLRTEEEALKAKELEEEQTEEGVIEDASEELEAVLPKEEVETEVVAEEKQKEPKETSEIKVVVEGASFIEDEKNELSLISEEDRESLEELFTSVPEEVNFEDSAQEDLDEIDDEKKKKKSKRKKFIEIEYDPDADMILTHKKHKRNEADWEEKW